MPAKEYDELIDALKNLALEFEDGTEDGTLTLLELLGLADNIFEVAKEIADFDAIIDELTQTKEGQIICSIIRGLKNLRDN